MFLFCFVFCVLLISKVICNDLGQLDNKVEGSRRILANEKYRRLPPSLGRAIACGMLWCLGVIYYGGRIMP